MKCSFCLFYILLFIMSNDCLSNNLDSSAIKMTNKIMMNDSIKSDSIIRVDESEFKYADTKRYTISGDLPYASTHFKLLPTIGVTSSIVSLFIAQHIFQVNSIWKNQTGFRITENWEYGLYADKFGHFYSGNLISYLFRESLIETGMSDEMSNIIGASLGLTYMTYIEVLDGFSKEWAFEPSDFYFDVLGSIFFLSQYYVTYLQNITPKGNYLNPGWYGESKRVPSSNFIDDYSGQTFFFSFNVYNMLPVNLKRYWVDGLELSVGYAARNLSDGSNLLNSNSNKQYYPGVWGSPRFIFALDYNLVKLLPDGPPFWNWLKQTLNRFKLPSPALEVGPDIEPRFKIMYPFF